VRSYSREANDLGQIIFALFVAVSVTAATRAGTHLSVDLLARQPRTARPMTSRARASPTRARCAPPCCSRHAWARDEKGRCTRRD
jgi:hypothetical protein